MKKSEVLALIHPVSVQYDMDPLFLLALCERESSCDESEVRLENGFYRRYSRPMAFLASTEVLLSASYGLTQVMGEVLYELGYFGGAKDNVAALIDAYMAKPELHIEYACRLIERIKKTATHPRQILLRYNGGGNPNYPTEVMNIYARLCREHDRTPIESPV